MNALLFAPGKPARTDHAFLAPQGRLEKALARFARRPLGGITGEAPGTTHPLVGFLAGTPRGGTDAQGAVQRIPAGARLLVCAVDAAAGTVTVLVRGGDAVRRLDVYADVLADAFPEGSELSLLDALLGRLANL